MRAVAGPDGPLFLLSPSSYCERDFLRQGRAVVGIVHTCSALALLGTLLFGMLALRLAQDLAPYLDGQSLETQLLGAFPAGLELRVANGTLRMSPEGESVRMPVPQVLLDVCGGALTASWILSLGHTDLHIMEALVDTVFGRGLPSLVDQDPYVRVMEFAPGEQVEAYLDHDLIACGAPRLLMPPPVSGTWLPAVVEAVHPSSSLADFWYSLRLGPKGSGSASTAESATKPSCKVRASSVRQRQNAIFVAPSEEKVDKAWLEAERPVLVFEESRFGILEGYSHHHGQHWQYVGTGEGGSRRARRSRLWHPYELAELHAYKPLSCAVRLLCSKVTEDLSEQSPDLDLHCSRDVAQQHVHQVLERSPALAVLLRLSLHLPLFFTGLWMACVASTLCVRFVLIVLIYTPTAYVTCYLLRHVDTPIVPISRIFGLVLYTAMPPVYVCRLTKMLWKTWGADGHLWPAVEAAVQWETDHQFIVLLIWALWTSFLVIRMREHNAWQEHLQRLNTQQLRRHAPASAAAGGQWAALLEPDRDAPGVATEGRAAGAPEPPGAEAAGVGGMGEAADCSESSSSASCSDQRVGDGGAEAGADGESAQHVCRICYGGPECGRLISPCLCSGTMRLVHLECLNMWRMASSNPQSFYQCDQCGYRYSFKRTLYAKILRSAIVLHIFTLAAFATTVVLCSFIAMALDGFFHSSSAVQSVLSDEVIEQFANETNTTVELLREQLAAFTSASWCGIHLVHLFSGLMMVGISGFVSMGFHWFPVLGGRGHRGVEVPLIVLVGAIRVMFGIYRFFKVSSGWLLQSAESRILDVGLGCPQMPPQHSGGSPGAGAATAGDAGAGAAVHEAEGPRSEASQHSAGGPGAGAATAGDAGASAAVHEVEAPRSEASAAAEPAEGSPEAAGVPEAAQAGG